METNKELLAVQWFRELYITTYEEILPAIQSGIDSYIEKARDCSPEEQRYLNAKVSLLRSLSEQISKTPLFRKLEPGWMYIASIGSRGAILHLRHCDGFGIVEFDEGEQDLEVGDCDASFDLIKIEPRLLSSEEYAQKCGVSPDTIRMWIRRGKIRSAVKQGNAWKIPETTEPIVRGFRDVCYQWDTAIDDAPADMRFLLEPGEISIRQMRGGTNPFWVDLQDRLGMPYSTMRLTAADNAKLEAFLIAHPRITYTGDLEYITKTRRNSNEGI